LGIATFAKPGDLVTQHHRRSLLRGWLALALLCVFASDARAKEWVVAPGGTGQGTTQAPFGTVQAALLVAQPGDIVRLRAGTYQEAIRTVRSGAATAPITVRGERGASAAVITTRGRVLQIDHSFITIQDVVIDAAYGSRTAVKVSTGTRSVTLNGVEVRRSTRDCVDIGAAMDVLIENSLIHHCLNAAGGRTDAHGVVAGAVRGLTIRGTEIHSFSGDAIQLNRTGTSSAAGWDEVVIERCRLWLAPLPNDENGFPAGTVPGENALDTKVADAAPRARITIRDTEAWGFKDGLIRVQAAFNLKENIDATVDRVTVKDSNVAFRLRGSDETTTGAWVRVQNAVIHDVRVAIRYEDNIERLRIWNTTFGRGIGRTFENELTGSASPDVRNSVILGRALPREAKGSSNVAADESAFINAASHDYRPAPGSRLIDRGTTIGDVATDRTGITRPQGAAFDVGAFEMKVESGKWKESRKWKVESERSAMEVASSTPRIRAVGSQQLCAVVPTASSCLQGWLNFYSANVSPATNRLPCNRSKPLHKKSFVRKTNVARADDPLRECGLPIGLRRVG
jgi:hypothetical protein